MVEGKKMEDIEDTEEVILIKVPQELHELCKKQMECKDLNINMGTITIQSNKLQLHESAEIKEQIGSPTQDNLWSGDFERADEHLRLISENNQGKIRVGPRVQGKGKLQAIRGHGKFTKIKEKESEERKAQVGINQAIEKYVSYKPKQFQLSNRHDELCKLYIYIYSV